MVCPCPGRTYVERVNRPTPLRKPRAHRPGLHRHHVVIVGAGFGGLAAARALADAPVDVTIVDAHNHHTFQPLLYQVATAGLGERLLAEARTDGVDPGPDVRYSEPRLEILDLSVFGLTTVAPPWYQEFAVESLVASVIRNINRRGSVTRVQEERAE